VPNSVHTLRELIKKERKTRGLVLWHVVMGFCNVILGVWAYNNHRTASLIVGVFGLAWSAASGSWQRYAQLRLQEEIEEKCP
jgi:hypothetical protein